MAAIDDEDLFSDCSMFDYLCDTEVIPTPYNLEIRITAEYSNIVEEYFQQTASTSSNITTTSSDHTHSGKKNNK
jgi:hypothetical protein